MKRILYNKKFSRHVYFAIILYKFTLSSRHVMFATLIVRLVSRMFLNREICEINRQGKKFNNTRQTCSGIYRIKGQGQDRETEIERNCGR